MSSHSYAQRHILPWTFLLLVLFTTIACRSNSVQAFLPSSAHLPTTTTPLYSTQKERQQQKQEQQLSEVDARVLREMLQSEKLDLKTEESMKKLLERGVTSKQVPQVPKGEESDSEFSSRVLQTLGDTKLWQAVQRKAGDWFESAKLYLQNRVERDAMTLAALGLFAWERAIRDVGRALPAASSASSSNKNKKQQLFLSEKSSFVTPMDELKSVQTAVAEILRTGGEASTKSTSTSTTLKTAATSRQDKRNFQRSYAQKTQQKQANVAQKAAATVTDTAWQVKRELQVEQNAPGYKTKQVKTALQAAQNSTRQLLQGAQQQWLLERAKTKQKWLLNEQEQQAQESEYLEVLADEVIILEDEEPIISTPPPPQVILETTPQPQEDTTTATTQPNQSLSTRELEAQKRQAQLQAERIEQERLRQEQLKKRKLMQYQQFQQDIRSEATRLQQELQNCIANPEQTWLKPDIVQDMTEAFDPTQIRAIVTQMIAIRNQLKDISKNNNNMNRNTVTAIPQELQALQGMVQQAVSIKAAKALQDLWFAKAGEDEEEENGISVFLRLDEWQELWDEMEPRKIQEEEDSSFFYAASSSNQESDETDYDHANYHDDEMTTTMDSVVISQIVDIIPEAFVAAVATTPMMGTTQRSSSSVVELVTDDDFEAAVGETKQRTVMAATDDNDETGVASQQKEADNFMITFLLRVLDIIFLLLEKTFTIALPALVTGSGVARERLDDIARGGLGSEGWKRIGNAREGAQRY